MEFFNQYGIVPGQEHFNLLGYLLVMTLLVHMPYLGLVMGATIVSLFLNVRDRDVANPKFARLAKDLMHLALPSKVIALVFGVLPLIVLWLIYGQWLAQSEATAMDMLPFAAVQIVLSFVLIFLYRATLYPDGRNSTVNLGIGALGALLLLGGTYGLIGCITRFNDPERWHLAYNPVLMMLSFNILWKFTYFLLSAFAMTGAALLFFFFSWSGRRPEMDDGYSGFVKNFGAGIGMASVLLIPVIGFFYLVTTPLVAVSGIYYGLAAATVVVLFLLFTYFYRAILSNRARFGAHAFTLVLLVFLLVAVGDRMTLVNATREHTAARVTEAEEIEAQKLLDREAHRAKAITVDVKVGEEVFQAVCSTCHRMNERLVGPPLAAVLPKYAGDEERLVSFIQKPEKVDPEYPPMPAPALSLGEIKSVAAYLLEQVETEAGAPGE